MKKIKFILLAAAMLVSCGAQNNNGVEYKISLQAQNGMQLKEGRIELYRGSKRVGYSDIKDGVATVKAAPGEYDIVAKNLQKGYSQKEEIKTSKNELEYTLTCQSSVIKEELPDNYLLYHGDENKLSYQLYDVMYDFDLTIYNSATEDNSNPTVEKRIKLSELLKEKKAVMLNFWYVTCSWCVYEFPYISEGYDLYSDKIAVIALNYRDDQNEINTYKESNGYQFDMAVDNLKLTTAFDIGAFPTSVVIDRYGMISHIQTTFKSLRDVTDMFEYFTSDDYIPVYRTPDEPDIPDIESPSMDAISQTANAAGCNATYDRNVDDEDTELNWPWLISETENAIYPGNGTHNLSFSIININVSLKVNDVFAFDYKSSCEYGADFLYIVKDGKIIKEITGVEEEYQTCNLYVANCNEDCSFSFCYYKDESSIDGDDCVYIKNVRTYPVELIDEPTYVLREAAYGGYNPFSKKYNNYVSIVMNNDDNLYHVGSINGPLLLANLIKSSLFNEYSVYEIINYYTIDDPRWEGVKQELMNNARMAGNTLDGYVPVTQELANALKEYSEIVSTNNYEEKWLEICCYFDAYGTDGKEYPNPVIGLSISTAITASLGEENYATFDRVIVPRGLNFKFTASEEGVYHFYSISSVPAKAWYYTEEEGYLGESLYNERGRYWAVKDQLGAKAYFHDYYYLEENQTIYLSVGFEDIYAFDTLQFGIEYVGESITLFQFCSEGYFTTTLTEDGGMGEIISLGIDTQLGDDGYYHHVLKDGTLGSIIYADFSFPTTLIEYSLVEMLTNKNLRNPEGGKPFDFSSEGDKDRTSEVQSYLSKIDSSSNPHAGCVPVDTKLQEILQAIAGYYGFNVSGAWQKLCYYYNTISK